jgi:hypothetical protein
MPRRKDKKEGQSGPKWERMKIRGRWTTAVRKALQTLPAKNNGDNDTEECDDDGDDAA